MDLVYLFTTSDGRLNRKPFWLALLLYTAVSLVVVVTAVVCFYALGTRGRRAELFTLTVDVMLAFPLIALGAKRLHDRNRSGYLMAFAIGPWLLYDFTNLIGLTGDQSAPTRLDWLLIAVNTIATIWFAIYFALRGTIGPNRFGPDPLEQAPRP